MSWIVLHFIGIISYAASGAFVALEVEYSFVGVFALGLTTSFGGALVRNLIIGVPVSELWDHATILTVLVTLTFIVLLPLKWINHWKQRSLFFDSIGLASFALQGAMSAKEYFADDLGVMVLASMFTGVGGGMIRDIMAARKPLALKEEIHAILTILCAICIWIGWSTPLQLTLIVVIVITLRMSAIHYQWRFHLPSKKSRKTGKKTIEKSFYEKRE